MWQLISSTNGWQVNTLTAEPVKSLEQGRCAWMETRCVLRSLEEGNGLQLLECRRVWR
jgi:hypothetical protein